MDLLHTEWKRNFSISFYKNLKLKLSEMSFYKDFINDSRGDLYPILEKSQDCTERISYHRYQVQSGSVKRLMGQFFPYATYEMSVGIACGTAGFCFRLPGAEASVLLSEKALLYSCGETKREIRLPDYLDEVVTMLVSCRPGAFDVYFQYNDKAEFFCTLEEVVFCQSNQYSVFADNCIRARFSPSAP